MTTVIADDDALAVRALLRVLAPYDKEIEVIGIAENGRKGVEMIDQLRPELAFIDLEMPLLDGFEVTRRLAHQPLIVFVTAGKRRNLDHTAALDLLCKPIGREDIASLMNRIRGALRLPAVLQFRPGIN